MTKNDAVMPGFDQISAQMLILVAPPKLSETLALEF